MIGPMVLRFAEHLARRIEVDGGADVRPLLWAEVGMSCFCAGYQIWLNSGGDLEAHIAAARRVAGGIRPVGARHCAFALNSYGAARRQMLGICGWTRQYQDVRS
ncbi:hypothetical protein [Nocardia sp. NPDC051463]|uniref:hypothetical protein n=1 Tax=Nocardia sp. NPDC051463 TaxID=3154845 RepID=UPI00344C9A5E